jgi:hypothetical protein
MIYQGRTGRRAAQVARSQLAVRLGLAIYAALATLIALRLIVLLLAFPETVWTVKTILSLSAPAIAPLAVLPAAQRPLLGSATLSDLTAALVIVALPLPFLGNRVLT